ncbi:MAG: sigma-54-dependent Fis family transcriptional regulator [Planctomycetes bacterium]|nr:sigma-54-dependent Fis family transcriptional regulator [Planctomycetota bacterium]
MASGSKVLDRLDTFALEGIESEGRSGSTIEGWIQLVKRAARSNCTILIGGETGVGKEHLAKWVHRNSLRRDHPFLPVNCGAIPESLTDSQLFGHVRGSFSGATSDHLGLVRAAEGGTLFLDEIGELPASAQTRLLRLLQEHEVQPVGRSRPIVVDVRVIAAANIDLRQAVADSKFREDLLFRLDVIQLRVKPLRERPTEMPILLEAFNGEFAALYKQPKLVFDRSAMNLLRCYPWPGNIRQLRSVVERLHVLCPGQPVTAQRLQEICQLQESDRTTKRVRSLKQVKLEAVQRVLADSRGSISRAAAIFGVHRSTIYRWLQER